MYSICKVVAVVICIHPRRQIMVMLPHLLEQQHLRRQMQVVLLHLQQHLPSWMEWTREWLQGFITLTPQWRQQVLVHVRHVREVFQ